MTDDDGGRPAAASRNSASTIARILAGAEAEFGTKGLKYTYIVNDTQAVNKATDDTPGVDFAPPPSAGLGENGLPKPGDLISELREDGTLRSRRVVLLKPCDLIEEIRTDGVVEPQGGRRRWVLVR